MTEFAPQNLRMNIPGNWVPPVLVKVCMESDPVIKKKRAENPSEVGPILAPS